MLFCISFALVLPVACGCVTPLILVEDILLLSDISIIIVNQEYPMIIISGSLPQTKTHIFQYTELLVWKLMEILLKNCGVLL